jgi:hypothetical protein
MKRITLIVGGVLIAWGALGVLDALGLIHISVCGLFWACLIIGAGVWLVWGAATRLPSVQEEEVSIPLEGASEAEIRLTHAAGRLQVQGGAGVDRIVEGRFAGGVAYKVSRSGDRLDVDMRVQGDGVATAVLPWKWPRTRGAEWTVRLNEAIPLTLRIEGGASENRLDLAQLRVQELHVETGASSTKLTLPSRAGQTQAQVSCGAGAVEIQVPPEVGARIRAHSALGEVKVDGGRFPGVEAGVYQSADYETASNRVDLRVEVSLGSIKVY